MVVTSCVQQHAVLDVAREYRHELRIHARAPDRQRVPDDPQRQTGEPKLQAETHGGDDVGVWARGPGSEAVRGNLEQNTLFHLMLQAQPTLRKVLCDAGGCEHGVPVTLPDPLRFARPSGH